MSKEKSDCCNAEVTELDKLLVDVVKGKFGTKHKAELITRLENIIKDYD